MKWGIRETNSRRRSFGPSRGEVHANLLTKGTGGC